MKVQLTSFSKTLVVSDKNPRAALSPRLAFRHAPTIVIRKTFSLAWLNTFFERINLAFLLENSSFSYIDIIRDASFSYNFADL